jgi:tripartite-type tricarboxylate transporter receptor subunit TctC
MSIRNVRRNNEGKACVVLGLAALFFLLCTSQAQAQDYPVRPVTINLGSTPGAAGGISCQIFAEGARKYLPKSQPILLNYKPGAASAVAADFVLKQPADGYNLLWVVQDLLVKLAKDGPQMSFKKEDFIPVGIIGASPPLLTINKQKRPFEKLEDFLDYAKKNPGTLSFGSVGLASGTHLTGEIFQMRCGIKLNHVPFQGGAPVVTALLGGHIDCCVLTAGSVRANLEPAGDLRALAVFAPERFHELPNVPTFMEKGYDIDRNNWYALAAPKGTPQGVVDVLVSVFKKAGDDPEVKSALMKAGYTPQNLGPEETGRSFTREYEFAQEIFKKLGM